MPELQQHRLEKAVYIAYQVVVGAGGPDVVIGRATTRCAAKRSFQETQPSHKVVISQGALVVGCHLPCGARRLRAFSDVASWARVSTLPVTLYAIIFPVVFAVLLAMIWRHNHSAYQRQYADWDHSFICQQCGMVSQHDLGDPVSLARGA